MQCGREAAEAARGSEIILALLAGPFSFFLFPFPLEFVKNCHVVWEVFFRLCLLIIIGIPRVSDPAILGIDENSVANFCVGLRL